MKVEWRKQHMDSKEETVASSVMGSELQGMRSVILDSRPGLPSEWLTSFMNLKNSFDLS